MGNSGPEREALRGQRGLDLLPHRLDNQEALTFRQKVARSCADGARLANVENGLGFAALRAAGRLPE